MGGVTDLYWFLRVQITSSSNYKINDNHFITKDPLLRYQPYVVVVVVVCFFFHRLQILIQRWGKQVFIVIGLISVYPSYTHIEIDCSIFDSCVAKNVKYHFKFSCISTSVTK